jgi:Histidine kinase
MRYRRILIIIFHIVGCISFLGLPFLFAPDAVFNSWIISPPGRRDLISGMMLIGFFYLNFYKLLPALYFNRKKAIYFGIITLCFVVVSFLPSLLTGHYHRGDHMRPWAEQGAPPMGVPPPMGPQLPMTSFPHPPGRFGIFESGPQFFLFLIVFLFSMGLAVHDRWRMEEKERIRVELHYLKSQLNPHFLFNAMNGIYSLTLEKSDQAPKAVLMLSSMMRYVFSRDKEMLVSLREELEYIENYISLQRLRFGDQLKVEYHINGDSTGKTIAPMILVPLVENAFKHGVNMEADSFIRLRIDITTTGLEMEVFNHKVPMADDNDASSGLGIRNTRNRLELQYPGVYSLKILNDHNTFTSILHIQWIS